MQGEVLDVGTSIICLQGDLSEGEDQFTGSQEFDLGCGPLQHHGRGSEDGSVSVKLEARVEAVVLYPEMIRREVDAVPVSPLEAEDREMPFDPFDPTSFIELFSTTDEEHVVDREAALVIVDFVFDGAAAAYNEALDALDLLPRTPDPDLERSVGPGGAEVRVVCWHTHKDYVRGDACLHRDFCVFVDESRELMR